MSFGNLAEIRKQVAENARPLRFVVVQPLALALLEYRSSNGRRYRGKGLAICNDKDDFDAVLGERIAFGRAVKDIALQVMDDQGGALLRGSYRLRVIPVTTPGRIEIKAHRDG